MDTRNLTLRLSADLIRKAKIYAAEHDTTINTVVRELLQEAVAKDGKIQAAGRRILEIIDRGPYSDVDPATIRREELHECR